MACSCIEVSLVAIIMTNISILNPIKIGLCALSALVISIIRANLAESMAEVADITKS